MALGRTVPSFRMAAEIERTKWKHFKSLFDNGLGPGQSWTVKSFESESEPIAFSVFAVCAHLEFAVGGTIAAFESRTA